LDICSLKMISDTSTLSSSILVGTSTDNHW
jgi:hypothetical protein